MDAVQRIKEDAITSILNIVSASGASRHLDVTCISLAKTLQRLTVGQRLGRAADGTVRLGIQLDADIRIAKQNRRNATDSLSYLQAAEDGLEQVTCLLTRAAELASQAAAPSRHSSGALLDAEFQGIMAIIGDIGQKTRFNGAAVFTPKAVSVKVDGFSTISFTVGTLGTSGPLALGLPTLSSTLATVSGASTASDLISSAIHSASSRRASLGASMRQLTDLADSLGIQVENVTAACSQAWATSFTEEIVNLTKFQILRQSGSGALGQATPTSQQILALLRLFQSRPD